MKEIRNLLLASLAVACGASFGLGCGKAPPEEPPWEHPVVGAGRTDDQAPPDFAAGPKPPLSRSVARMKIDTLQASMTAVAGKDIYGNPIVWKFNGNNGFSDAAFGKALGRPDYQTSTEEATVSSALYLKFVGDAARDICMQMAKNDAKRTDPAARALFPKAPIDGAATDAQIQDNIKYVMLRFWGLRAADQDPMIASLRKVYDAGVASVADPNGGEIPKAAEGWRGVCVAAFESPLFHND